MKWQDINKRYALLIFASFFGIFGGILNLTGMDYTVSGDSHWVYDPGLNLYKAEGFFNITSTYWRVCFDLDYDTDKPYFYKKISRGRTLWLSLNPHKAAYTLPGITTQLMVPARGKNNWRDVKQGDCIERPSTKKINRFKIVGLMKYPQRVKWGIDWDSMLTEGIKIDPVFIEPTKDRIFKELKQNDRNGKSKFTLNNPYSVDDGPKLKISFNEVCGKVNSYKIFIDINCTEHIKIPNIKNNQTCEWAQNGTFECIDDYYVDSYNESDRIYPCKKEMTELSYGDRDYYLEADIEFDKCPDGSFGYEIDWIPTLETKNVSITQSDWAWWNASFTYCRNIEILGADSTLDNFTVMINITDTTHMNESGGGLVFIDEACDDDGSQLDHEKESFATDDSLFWVEIPSVPTSNYNISIYYEPTDNTDYSNAPSTWNDDYVFVHHLENLLDSSINSHDASNNGASQVTGLVDGAYDFELSESDYMDLGDHADFSFSAGIGADDPFSLSMWMKLESMVTQFLYTKHDNSINKEWSLIWVSNEIKIILFDSGGDRIESDTDTGLVSSLGVWYHIVTTYDGSYLQSGLKIYVNGALQSVVSGNVGNYDGMLNTNQQVIFGARENNGATQLYFDGVMDEVRLISAELSADWIDYSYKIITDQGSYVTIGTEQTETGAPTTIEITDFCGDITNLHVSDLNCTFNATGSGLLTWDVNDTRIDMISENASGQVFDNPSLGDYNLPSGWNISVNVSNGINVTTTSFIYKISNTAPIIDNLCDDPTTIFHNQELNCEINASDADGDAIIITRNDTRINTTVFLDNGSINRSSDWTIVFNDSATKFDYKDGKFQQIIGNKNTYQWYNGRIGIPDKTVIKWKWQLRSDAGTDRMSMFFTRGNRSSQLDRGGFWVVIDEDSNWYSLGCKNIANDLLYDSGHIPSSIALNTEYGNIVWWNETKVHWSLFNPDGSMIASIEADNCSNTHARNMTWICNDGNCTLDDLQFFEPKVNLSHNPLFTDYNLPACWNVLVTANDTINFTSGSFDYCINNTAPIFNETLLNLTINHTNIYNLTYNWFDLENDNISVTVNITNMTATVNNLTKTFELYFSPSASEVGYYAGRVTLDDGGLSTTQDFELTVAFVWAVSVESYLELGSIENVTAGNGTAICIDVDHPEYGVNYSCGSSQLAFDFNITYFRQTNFTGNGTKIGPSNETLFIPAHQYDEVVSFQINLSGTLSNDVYPTNVLVYINDTLVLTENILSNVSDADVLLNKFTNNQTNIELTFDESETNIAYVKIPKSANVTRATFNITGSATEYEIKNPEDTLGSANSDPSFGPIENSYLSQNFSSPDTITGIKFSKDHFGDVVIALWNDTDLIEETTFTDDGREFTFYLTDSYTPGNNENFSIRINATDNLLGIKGYTDSIFWKERLVIIIGGTDLSGFILSLWQIILGQTNMTNVTIDIGALDGNYEWNYTGGFGITEPVTDFSSVLNSYLSTCTQDANGDCDVPIYVSSVTEGIANLTDLNITYHYDTTQEDLKNISVAVVQSFLDASSGYTSIPLRIYNPGNGTVVMSEVNYDYAGGNDSINVSVHGSTFDDYYFSIHTYYSDWNFTFPQNIQYLEFIPRTPTSTDVEPYGQTSTRPMFNITSYGYSNRTANFSITLNETFSCVNLTVSTVYNKSMGTQLNTSWSNLFAKNYLEYDVFWLWADYGCNYTNWNNWYPDLYIRACCENCTCSEDLS